jgi:hypothetical protein
MQVGKNASARTIAPGLETNDSFTDLACCIALENKAAHHFIRFGLALVRHSAHDPDGVVHVTQKVHQGIVASRLHFPLIYMGSWE